VIVLRSSGLLVRIDPDHGGEILDLVDLGTGRQLLGRPPFGSTAPVAGDLDESSWTAAYRGGWQLLLPNAGSSCTVDGTRHGFHGRASNDPWSVEIVEPDRATLAWAGHGIAATRSFALEGGALAVSVNLAAQDKAVPLVAVEHVALGLELLEPEVELELAGGRAFELDEEAGPPRPPADATDWPEVRLLDGTTERADRWSLERRRSRLLCVTELPAFRIAVRNVARDHGVEILWDGKLLRHAWVWHEARSYGGSWRQHGELLVVEPASVPHSLGLATAIEQGQATWLEPGEPCTYTIAVHPLTRAKERG
jgi:hypothetical protein